MMCLSVKTFEKRHTGVRGRATEPSGEGPSPSEETTVHKGCNANASLMGLETSWGGRGRRWSRGRGQGTWNRAAIREVLGAPVTEGCVGHDKELGVLL